MFDVLADGTIANNRLFLKQPGGGTFDEGIPDGMKCDERGYALRYGPRRRLGHQPGRRAPRHDRDAGGRVEPMTSAALTGRTLYITASRSVYRVPMKGARRPRSARARWLIGNCGAVGDGRDRA